MNFTFQYIKSDKSLSLKVRLLSIFFLLLFSTICFSQEKTKKKVTIRKADVGLYNEDIVKNAQRLVGNVELVHKNMIMKCDSAWAYSGTNMVDAFGNVHIISNDTVNMWADYIKYDGNKELAKARKNVKLQDPSLTLYTDSLDFDMNKEIGYYNYNGKIVDSTNVLTSKIGEYHTKKHEVYFIENVQLVNKDYNVTTDTMIYNTDTEIIYFDGETRIVGDSTNMYSKSGWFNTKTNETEMGKQSTLRRGETQLQADYIYYNDNTGEGNAEGNVIINDYANQMIVAGEKATYNDFSQFAQVTDSAIWIQYFEGDSLFLHADTLYSKPDTTSANNKLLITYGDVRFFRSDIQGVSDSLIYFTRDSTIQLYVDPVIWSASNQLSANFIEFKNNSTGDNKVYLKSNSFIVQENDSTKYNQIKGKNMIGNIRGQELFKIDVDGNGQSIYYPIDDEGFIGVNKAESSKIILYLKDNMVTRINFSGTADGAMNPIPDNPTPETRLDGFKWRNEERPTSRYDIFGNQAIEDQPKVLPETKIENVLPNVNNAEQQLDSTNLPVTIPKL